jgi:hypothetical protein
MITAIPSDCEIPDDVFELAMTILELYQMGLLVEDIDARGMAGFRPSGWSEQIDT